MTRTHDIARRRAGNRIALMGALLFAAAASFALAVPERASAGPESCPRGHFCIWEHADYLGGMFHWSGSDSNLFNDDWAGTNRVVANKGSAVWNNGHPQPGPRGRDDVIVYATRGPRSSSLCIHNGDQIPHLSDTRQANGGDWNDDIVRYRWVTNRECARADSQTG